MAFNVPEKHRVATGGLATDSTYGNNGQFRIQEKGKPALNIIACDGGGWEHVSVSTYTRTPTWEEMCKVKDLFWDEDDYVIQIHPAKSEYVNNHKYCLHLWRRENTNWFFVKPDIGLVGTKDADLLRGSMDVS